MRTVEAVNGKMLLYNRLFYQRQLPDQGCWPDSLLTTLRDNVLRIDVELTKAMGCRSQRPAGYGSHPQGKH